MNSKSDLGFGGKIMIDPHPDCSEFCNKGGSIMNGGSITWDYPDIMPSTQSFTADGTDSTCSGYNVSADADIN